MSDARSYTCPGCKGLVCLPKGRRATPGALDTIKAIHDPTCPSRRQPK